MSRALRRQQAGKKQGRQRGDRRPLPRPAAAGGGQRGASGGGPPSAGSILRPRWATDIISELQKVTWPSREDTQYLTLVVLVVAVAFGIFLGGVDMFFNWAIDNTLLRN